MIGFPLLIVPLAIFNMIAFILDLDWGTKLYTFPLISRVEWTLTLGDAFLVFSLVILMFEFIKSTSHGKSVVEHLLSILLAGGAGAEFVMVPKAANSVFMLFTVICIVDMFAGFAASLRRARRKQVVETVAPAPYPQPVPTPPPAPFPPAPAPAAPVVRPEAKPEPTVVVPRTEPPKLEPAQKIEP